MAAQRQNEDAVVLVDDEEEILFGSSVLLEAHGVSPVVTLNDGRELLPYLASRGAGIIVLDLFMPHVSGTELLPEIVQRHPEIPVVVMTASQEIETALRYETPMVILIWQDSQYGLIRWHQEKKFGRPSNISFTNPDFVKYAESFGAKGIRVESAGDLVPAVKQAAADNTITVIDRPVDYSENMKLTAKLGELVCPI